MYHNTAKIQTSSRQPIPIDDSSNTYIYGVHNDGSCIGRARLSNQRLERMRNTAKKSRIDRVTRLEEARLAAIDGFEMLMQVLEYEDAVQYYLPLAVESWTNYFARTVQFGLINDAFFRRGIHLVLLGGHTDNGSLLVRPKVVPHDGILSEYHLQLIARKPI